MSATTRRVLASAWFAAFAAAYEAVLSLALPDAPRMWATRRLFIAGWPVIAGMGVAAAWLGGRIPEATTEDSEALRTGTLIGALGSIPAVMRWAERVAIPDPTYDPARLVVLPLYFAVWGVVPHAVIGAFAGWALVLLVRRVTSHSERRS